MYIYSKLDNVDDNIIIYNSINYRTSISRLHGLYMSKIKQIIQWTMLPYWHPATTLYRA